MNNTGFQVLDAMDGIVYIRVASPLIDEDVREEYWTQIRKRPHLKSCTQT